jgi:hypothetical protein
MTVVAEPRPLFFPDVEAVVAGFLAGRPDLAGVPVGSLLPAGFDGTQRAVVVTRLGGVFADDDRVDTAEVRFDSYGPGKVAAHAVARLVRGLLPALPATVLPDGVVCTDVSEVQGPCFSRDRRNADAERYIMKYRFALPVSSRPA